jgi:hypothetical protein
MNDDRMDARLLLERALENEPAIGVDAGEVLDLARRGVRRRRAATIGAVAAGVAGVTLMAVAVTASPPSTLGVADPPPPSPPSPSGIHQCIRTNSPSTCVPSPPLKKDPTTEGLTAAFAEADVIPHEFQVLKAEPTNGEPLVFARDTPPEAPIMSARLQDSRGSGILGVVVGKDLSLGMDPIHCSPALTVLSCTERRMPDGAPARVIVVAGTAPGVKQIQLTLLRANGTYLDARVSNEGPMGAKGPTRDEPPLGVEGMFKIGAIAGLTL